MVKEEGQGPNRSTNKVYKKLALLMMLVIQMEFKGSQIASMMESSKSMRNFSVIPQTLLRWKSIFIFTPKYLQNNGF